MKRIISAILCILTVFSLFACGTSGDTEYEKIKLTKENYSDYINIDIYIDDYSFIASEQYSSKCYDMSVVVHIETSKKADCTFEDVSITYSPSNTASRLWQYTYNDTLPDATLNLEGESHISYAATKANSPFIDIWTSVLTSTNNIVHSIEGFVIVPKKK